MEWHIWLFLIILFLLILLNFILWKHSNNKFYDKFSDITTSNIIPTVSSTSNNIIIPTVNSTSNNIIIPTTMSNEIVIPTLINSATNTIMHVPQTTNLNYVSVDNLADSLTDPLGSISSKLGYSILQEQTNKGNEKVNPNVYDNTQSYKTGINPDTLDTIVPSITHTAGIVNNITTVGNGKEYKLLSSSGGPPIYMQKDFAGVANIFAPNIYIANPPLNSDGYPDISYSV